jgi:hypothetical protein
MQTKEEKAAYNKQYNKQYNIDNREKRAAYDKQYNIDNKEKKTAIRKQYRIANKEKIAAYNKKYRESTKGDRLAYYKQRYQANKKNREARRYVRQLEIFEYKGGACAHCFVRELDYMAMYDYHHTDPATKLHAVATVMYGPLDRVLTEVDKCLLLCSNCHRKEHVRLYKEKINE